VEYDGLAARRTLKGGHALYDLSLDLRRRHHGSG
jgi:hypothetical protein